MLDKTSQAILEETLTRLSESLESGNIDAALELFQDDCYWRDLVTFTWNLRTMEGKAEIRDMLTTQLARIKPASIRPASDEPASGDAALVEGWIEFDTEVSRGFGHIRIKEGRIWTLLTTMSELKDFEECKGATRPMGAEHGVDKNRMNWTEKLAHERDTLGYTEQPYCVVVGGGQGGIALGARLRHLNVPTIIIEKNPKAGDSWRNRYKSLCLHDPVWYDHLPYLPFPSTWPVFAPKDKIGDWLEMYTKIMELNYWTSSEATNAYYDEEKKEWVVKVNRDGEEVTLRPKQLVMATGMSGKANVPDFTGQDVFKGEQQHSSQHPGPDNYAGKKVVVLGANNSAHDICAALAEAGIDVTMVQRSSTHIVRSDSLMDIGLGALYSEEAVANGMTTRKADLIFASLPYKIMHEFQIPLYQQMKERDAQFYADLEKAGFMLDWGDDESGLFMKYLRRGSGYYIDVGACQLIIDGTIKLVSGVGVEALDETGVILSDGQHLDADLIVYATGFGSMNGWVEDLIDKGTAEKVGKVWGLGSQTTKDPGPWEGEQRNMWKPTQQDALWFHGGNLHQSRHYSQYLSLQLKARMEGLDTPTYKLQESHHLQ
ncbi:NAD(P)/FAD-dependent oxidoreductase [Granulosicoccus antarcticus]|uniref:Putative oxidoreductase CzcO n=1 Tax=Granulosicoccus antarcticus IMCC3135 TaxID=1192854 RepID=A0A2Z2NW99_9GAMM|nr:NAD(P)/FAD-dependent oxidoreductase [Granulosicoccus antarcticus]ASJ74785.1 putative oxidoreductase CzcO [Granulosicoccus antarcticus IMCC3135]